MLSYTKDEMLFLYSAYSWHKVNHVEMLNAVALRKLHKIGQFFPPGKFKLKACLFISLYGLPLNVQLPSIIKTCSI